MSDTLFGHFIFTQFTNDPSFVRKHTSCSRYHRRDNRQLHVSLHRRLEYVLHSPGRPTHRLLPQGEPGPSVIGPLANQQVIRATIYS